MKKLFIMFALISVCVDMSMTAAFAYYDAGALNSQYMRDLRVHEAMTRSRNKSAIVTAKTAPKADSDVVLANINKITFVNNASIPSTELFDVVSDKINKPMNAENVSQIRKDIMKYYQERGYFSALASVVSQDTQTGELIIEIKEGGKNSILIQE